MAGRKLINTKKLTHEEWVALRKSSIGGSDSAACVGMNQYSSLLTLYADKMGLSKDKETNEAMRLGTDLEEYVAKRFCEETGKKVINDTFFYQDDEYDFISANIDRKVVSENAGLECKTMGGFNGYNLDAGEVPSHYYCQCQHYMMVRGFKMMYLAILVLQRGLYIIPIDRNDEFIKQLREAEIAFWKDHIEKQIPPEPDGSDASMETLKEMYPDTQPNTELIIPGLDQMIRDYKAADEMEKKYSEKKAAIQGRICAKLGTTETGIGLAYGCSWKKQGRTSVPSAKLKAKYPAIYAELAETKEYRVFRTKEIKRR